MKPTEQKIQAGLSTVDERVRAHLHLITVLAEDINERNYADKALYIKQQVSRIMSAIEPAGVGVETDDQASLRNDLQTAIGIGPRVGSMSLLSAMKYRAAGRTIQSIADEAGVTKGAMNQALKKGASRLAALNGDKQ